MSVKVTTTHVCDYCGKEHKSEKGLIYAGRIVRNKKKGYLMDTAMSGSLFCNEDCLISKIKEWRDK